MESQDEKVRRSFSFFFGGGEGGDKKCRQFLLSKVCTVARLSDPIVSIFERNFVERGFRKRPSSRSYFNRTYKESLR